MRAVVTMFTIIIFLLLLFMYYFSSMNLSWPFDEMTREQLGQFGDSWGMLTSIFSALAFFGVLISNSLQRKALKHSEFITQKQTESLNLQNFEGNLFQMMNILQSIIQDMDIKKKNEANVVHSGRDCFYYYYNSKFKDLCSDDHWFGINDNESMKYKLKVRFDKLFNESQKDLGHYFRFLYNIFRYIEESTVSEEKKLSYSKVVRAQLSNFELIIIFYNCFSTHGGEFVNYAKMFELFDNLHVESLLYTKHVELIDRKAFGKNPYFDDENKVVTCHAGL